MSEPPPPPPTPRVKVDLVDGSQGKLDAFGWLEKQAIIRVSALPGAALHTSGDDVAFNALAAATAAGYTVDSAHPQCAALLLSGERSVAVKHASLAEISVTYRRPGADNRIIPRSLTHIGVKGSVVLIGEKTNKDSDGDDVVVEWKPDPAAAALKQTGLMDILLPSIALTFDWVTTAKPGPVFKTIVGKTNSDNFQGDAAGYWLCEGGDFSSPDEGVHWQVSAKFVYNENKWKQTVYYLADTGHPPGNWNVGQFNIDHCVQEVTLYGAAAMGTALAAILPSGMSLPDAMSALPSPP